MHNQKLFDKIRETLSDDTAEDISPLEWDKKAVWERIETQNSPRRGFAFGRWAAVAAAFIGILLLGKWLLNSHSSTQLPPSLVKVTPQRSLANPLVEPLKVAATQQEKALGKKNKSYGYVEKMLVVEDRWAVEPEDSSKLSQVVVQADAIISPQPQPLALLEKGEAFPRVEKEASDAHKSPLSQKEEGDSRDNVTPKERVLIVDIDIPDLPEKTPAQDLLRTTFLERFSRETRRLRTERKFDLRALDRRAGKGVWSLVAHSLVVPESK